MLISEYIVEIADKPYKPLVTVDRAEKYVAIIPQTASGARIQIRITQETADPGSVEVGFFDETDAKNPTIAATGKGDAFRIFATVGDVVKRYVAKYHPDDISFSGKSNEPARIKLYDQIARNMGKFLPGYHLVHDSEDERAGEKFYKFSSVDENFADHKGPGRPGDSQRHGIPKGATMAELEKASHAKGRKGQLARWQINMRRGKDRAHEDLATGLEEAWSRDFVPLARISEAKSKLSKEAQAAIPGASSSGVANTDQGPSNYYHKYRVGVAMASSPDTGNLSPVGPTSDDMVTIGYTAADRHIADRAYAAMGYKKKKVTGNHSQETDVNAVSPVAKPRKNRYGI